MPADAPAHRVGIFGGTFDPPHVGHLVTAVNVRHALALDVVLLMVANVPWQKEGSRSITPALDRLAMVEAAVADVPGLEAGRLEIDLGGSSYTADTLAAIAEADPGVELFTIVGDDAAAGLTTWERYEEVVARSALVVVDRPGEPVRLPGDVDWIHVEVPRLEVSSTDLRVRFIDGRPLDYLITDEVLDVIAARQLYRGER
jgi:nicotinate-nucleotide adenylyltransferase